MLQRSFSGLVWYTSRSPRSICLILVSLCFRSKRIRLIRKDGKMIQSISSNEDRSPIVSASIQDPYIAIKRADGSCSFFAGDPVSRTIAETLIPGLVSHVQTIKLTIRRNTLSKPSKSLRTIVGYIDHLKHKPRQVQTIRTMLQPPMVPHLDQPLSDKVKLPRSNLPRTRSCGCRMRSRQFRPKSLVYRMP